MVAMFRPDIDHLPEPSMLAGGFRVRWFCEGDENTWAQIECEAGEFSSAAAARARFAKDFPDPAWLHDRCLFIEDSAGEAVGTATAMSGQLAGRTMGQLGWVAVTPRHQGRGLGKCVVALALRRIAQEHRAIFLSTQTTSVAAVNIYLRCGFVPHAYGPDDEEAWQLLSRALGREIPPAHPVK